MRGWMLAATALVCVGCGGNDDNDQGGADLATASAPDLGMPADLSPPGAVDLAFGTDTDGSVACTPALGTTFRFVWNSETVPQTRTDFAWDLNGDGRADNALGNIEGALASQGMHPQDAVDAEIADGQLITLLEAQASDPTLGNDGCAAVDLLAGQAMASPDYSGNGHFTVDTTQMPGHLVGTLAAGRFTSEPPPAVARVPAVVHVRLPLFGVVPVDLFGARVTWLRGADGTLTGGQLNGAMRGSDVQQKVIPNVAAVLSAQVAANPGSSTSMQILSIFDTGGKQTGTCATTCQNPDGSCAKAGDGKIDSCEVATNAIIQNVLAPDVQMFDDAGNYHPNPLNTKKDSLSVGLGFTAVPASF